MFSCSLSFSRASSLCLFLVPITIFEYLLVSSVFWLKLAKKVFLRVSSSWVSSFLTSVRAMHEVCLSPTSFPRAAWLLTMAKGVSVALHSCGNQQTSSIGSQLAAMITSLAALVSTKWVTWLSPNFMATGAGDFVCFPSFLSFAACRSLAFLSCADSAGYFAKSLNKFFAT